MFGNRIRMMVGGLAAALALASAVPAVAEPVPAGPAALRAEAPDPVARLRWRPVRVPPGILAGIPTGASPTPPRLRAYLAPFPVGFAADPYYSPPAVAVVPPPIVFAPPFFAPPFLSGIAPIAWPFDGGCFVQSDFAGQHGYFGSCAESLYQQWVSRPY
jgi:hypothetical protein